MNRILPLAAVTAAIALLTCAGSAEAATAPIKEVVTAHFGWNVNKTKEQANAPQAERNVCTVASKDECQPGAGSGEPGGLASPLGLAVAPNGNVYVADEGNNRVEEFDPAGKLVKMLGSPGTAAGQFESPQSVAVDSAGNVYVIDFFNWRVQKFTPSGEFILMYGKEVNKKGGNVCTKAEESECKAGVQGAVGSVEAGAFRFFQGDGNLLAVGPSNVVYVGEEHRVQEFNSEGIPIGEIRVALEAISSEPESFVTSLTVDGAGDVYLVYSVNFDRSIIREFNPSGAEVKQFPVTPRRPGAAGLTIDAGALALDSAGDLAVTEFEGANTFVEHRGTLYEVGAASLREITEFTAPANSNIAFGGNALYAVTGNEVIAYTPLPVAQLVAGLASCRAGAVSETDATLDCTLNGEVDPWNVPQTEAGFEWGSEASGSCSLASSTPKQAVVTGVAFMPAQAPVAGLAPNERFCFRLSGYDGNVQPPEGALTSGEARFTTPPLPPRILGAPSVSFVTASSAVLSGELNPEHSSTRYEFQLAPAAACSSLREGCSAMASTASQESPEYARVPTTLEATGMQPATVYRYRLFAVNQAGEAAVAENGGAEIPEGTFQTAPAFAPQAVTGAFSAVTATSATISGTVNPASEPATYAFELGIYNGAGTQYGVVFTGPAGAGSAPVAETLGLSGLQPGTTYAYRIAVKVGAGNPVQGEPVTFTTAGLPSVLVVPTPLAMLAVPNIAFPKVVTPTTKALTNAQKLAKALKACKKRSKKQRAACQKQARKQYTKSKQANNRKKG